MVQLGEGRLGTRNSGYLTTEDAQEAAGRRAQTYEAVGLASGWSACSAWLPVFRGPATKLIGGPREAGKQASYVWKVLVMARDLLRRPPLRVSELPPHRVRMHRNEPRMIVCPGCDRWLKPGNGGLRRHTIAADGSKVCGESGRRVWFDLTAVEWLARLEVAAREAAQRRGSRVHRKASPPVPPPVFRLAAAS